MNSKCLFSGCADTPIYYCVCDRAKIYCKRHFIQHDNNPISHHKWEKLSIKINDDTKDKVLMFLNEKIAQINEIESNILHQEHIDMIINKKILKEQMRLIETEKRSLSELMQVTLSAKNVFVSDSPFYYLSMSPEDAIEKFKAHAPDIEKLKQKIKENSEASLDEKIQSLIQESCKNILFEIKNVNQKLDNHIFSYEKEKETQNIKINEIERFAQSTSDESKKEMSILKMTVRQIDCFNTNLMEKSADKSEIETINKEIFMINEKCEKQHREIIKFLNDINDRINSEAYKTNIQNESYKNENTRVNELEKKIDEVISYMYWLKNCLELLESKIKEGNNGITREEYKNELNNIKYHYENKLDWNELEPLLNKKISDMNANNSKNEECIRKLYSNVTKVEEIEGSLSSLKQILDEKSELVDNISQKLSIMSQNSGKIIEFDNEIAELKKDLKNEISTINLMMSESLTIQNQYNTMRSYQPIINEEKTLPDLNKLYSYFNFWKKKEHWLDIYSSEINSIEKVKQILENLKINIIRFMHEYTFLPMSVCDDIEEINKKIRNYWDHLNALEISYEQIQLKYYEDCGLSELFKEDEDLINIVSNYDNNYCVLQSMKQMADYHVKEFENFVITNKEILQLYENKLIYVFSSFAENKVELLSYNIESEFQTKIETSNYNFSPSTSIVQIPGNQLFCFGYKFPDIKTSYIIKSNGDIQQLSYSTIPRTDSSCIYYKNFIYIFGGSDINGSPLGIAEKFDLIALEYSIIKDIVPSKKCSCLQYNNEILICGYEHDKIYRYSVIEEDAYEMHLNESEQLTANNDKILFSGKNSVFIFDSNVGSIFIVDINNQTLSVIARNLKPNFQNPPYRSYFKNSIYFGFSTEGKAHYFKFNLDQYNLEEITH